MRPFDIWLVDHAAQPVANAIHEWVGVVAPRSAQTMLALATVPLTATALHLLITADIIGMMWLFWAIDSACHAWRLNPRIRRAEAGQSETAAPSNLVKDAFTRPGSLFVWVVAMVASIATGSDDLALLSAGVGFFAVGLYFAACISRPPRQTQQKPSKAVFAPQG